MLEYALRQERYKYLALQQQQQQTQQAKSSESPPSVTDPTTAGEPVEPPPVATKPSSNPQLPPAIPSSALPPSSGTLLNFSKGFGQARSREILKNYLREAGYLLATSSTPGSTYHNYAGNAANGQSSFRTDSPQGDENMVATSGNHSNTVAIAAAGFESERISSLSDNRHLAGSPNRGHTLTQATVGRAGVGMSGPAIRRKLSSSSLASNASSTATVMDSLSSGDGDKEKETGGTAFATLVPAGKRKVEDDDVRIGQAGAANSIAGLEEPLSNLSLTEEDLDEGLPRRVKAERIWRPRTTLRSHFDSVRSLVFHPSELALFSASEDATAKMWALSGLEPTSSAPGSRRNSNAAAAVDVEPVYTFRGHTAPVTSIDVSNLGDVVYTGSTDSSVRAWRIPMVQRETYSAYESLKLHTYVGHTNAVWDVRSHPLQSQYSLLATASADSTVRLWETAADSARGLRTSLQAPSSTNSKSSSSNLTSAVSLSWVNTDLAKLSVGYADGNVAVYDAVTGQVVSTLKADATYDGTPGTQLNKIICHPTMPLVITAHEDRYIRFFDLNTGNCTHSFAGHLDGVACLDINPSGLVIVSGGHDCSMRWWDLSTKSCIQEYTAHRKKNDEGMWAVRHHPVLDLLASGGADSVIKLYVYGDAE